MSGTEPRIGISSKLLIFISSAAVLCNYYYLYFISFTEGESESGSYGLLKIIGIACVCVALLRPAICTKYVLEKAILIALLLIATLIFLFKAVALGLSDAMFLNTVLCLMPLLIFRWRDAGRRVDVFFECCLLVMLLQVCIDFYIYFANLSIWENKAFIGGLGNPSSFGLVCNMLIAYILFERRPKVSSVLYFLGLCVGVVMTSSMLSSIALGLVLVAWVAQRLSLKKIMLILIGAIALPVVVMNFASDHLVYKMNSAINIFDDSPSSDSSRSVSLRVEIHKTYLDNLEKNPLQGVLYGFDDSSYMKFDSQILTYASSFGFVYTLLFFAVITLFMLKSAIRKDYFSTLCLLLFSITFATNRILDYYPLPLFLGLIIAISSSRSRMRVEQ